MHYRLTSALFLCTLFLLPWAWFPPFPWLHVHAQWGDAVFAVTAVSWAIEKWKSGDWPRFRPVHTALGFYLALAAASLLLASPERQAGSLKLLGMAELCMLLVITSDLASRPGMLQAIARVVAVTTLLTVIAAFAGLILFYSGAETNLIGPYGDLVESRRYARVQAGLYHPNLLGSYCIFAFSVVSRQKDALPRWLRRAVLIGLCGTVVLTFSRAMIGFGLAAVIGTARGRAKRRMAALYAVVSLSIIAALTIWNLSLDPTRPLGLHIKTAEPASRWETLTSSLRTLADRPLLGSGLGTSPGVYRGSPFDAHLTPLNIAATLGLPALLAFVSVAILLWCNRRRPADLALWGGLAGLALDSLAADIEEFRHVWLMLGLADADRSPLPVGKEELER